MRGQDLGWVSDGDPAEWDRGACWQRRTQVYDAVDAHLGAPAPTGRTAGGTRANENAVTNGERAAAHAAQNGRIHDHAIGADVDGTALGANHGSEADRDVGTDQHLAADRCVRRDAGRPVDNRPFSLVLKNYGLPLDGSDV